MKQPDNRSVYDNVDFRKLIENSYEGITLLDRNLSVIYRSPSAERITGWATTALDRKGAEATIHPDDLPAVRGVLQQLLTTGEASISSTFRTLHYEGYYIWVDCVFSDLLGDPDVEAIVCNFRDITEKKLSEEKFQQTYQELLAYKYALDESAIVAITDQKGVIKHVNENFCRISKYSLDELIGQDHRIINSQYHDQSYIRELWRTIAHGEIWKGELKNKAKDGTFYWVDTTIVPFLDEQRKPYQYVAIRSDITERKLSEMRLQQLNDDLKGQAKELAASNDELEQFAYVASHDLQEPLRMVTSFLMLLEKRYTELIDDKGRQYIHFAVDGAKRMQRIILDLLDFSRVGRTEVKLEDVPARDVIEEIRKLLQQQIADKRATLTCDNLPVLHTYRAPLRQVLLNLISNALKYQPVGNLPLVHVGVEWKAPYWQFSVSDNGIGIDKEYFDRIFVIFQRLHTRDEYAGTGMGLAVTKKIIENLGGRIWVESENGVGSTFYFTFLTHH